MEMNTANWPSAAKFSFEGEGIMEAEGGAEPSTQPQDDQILS